MTTERFDIDSLHDIVRERQHDALGAERLAAVKRLREAGLPTARDEDWRYTDLSAAIDIGNVWLENGAPAPDGAASRDTIEAITGAVDAHWIIVANGRLDGSGIDAGLPLEVSPLMETGDAVPAATALNDLNLALFTDGARIVVQDGIEKPVGVLVVDDPGTGTAVTQARIEIVVRDAVHAEVIEFHASGGNGDHWSNSVVSIAVGRAARVNYVRLQNRDLRHVQTSRLAVRVADDGEFSLTAADLGGVLVRNDIEIDLTGRNAHATFDGIYLAGSRQHIDNHTRVDHRTGPSTSAQDYRGIVANRGRAVWNGKAIVHDGADGTDARQSNRALLLDSDAEIDAKPELEIYADDVKCSHGATVGQLDNAQLFYLQSRGIGVQQARQLLTRAFAAELVARASIPALSDYLNQLVETRLQTLLPDEA